MKKMQILFVLAAVLLLTGRRRGDRQVGDVRDVISVKTAAIAFSRLSLLFCGMLSSTRQALILKLLRNVCPRNRNTALYISQSTVCGLEVQPVGSGFCRGPDGKFRSAFQRFSRLPQVMHRPIDHIFLPILSEKDLHSISCFR